VKNTDASSAELTALAAVEGLLGHHGGDYLVQDYCMARWKQDRCDRSRARRELAPHAVTYAATEAVTRCAMYRTAGVRVPLVAQPAAAVVEAVVHAVIDDGRLLKAYSRRGAGRDRFTIEDRQPMGRQQRFHDDVPGGRALMDQAAHHQLQIPLGTVVTVAVAGAISGRRAGRGGDRAGGGVGAGRDRGGCAGAAGSRCSAGRGGGLVPAQGVAA
jgi:hypothetical protein